MDALGVSNWCMYPRIFPLQVIALLWYPFEARHAYNPIGSDWFPLDLKHEMLFQSVLFSSASHLAHEDGRIEFEPEVLIPPVIQHPQQNNPRGKNTF